jgi:hypothetical protein
MDNEFKGNYKLWGEFLEVWLYYCEIFFSKSKCCKSYSSRRLHY